MDDFFSRLRTEREEKKLSLAEIYEKTRISINYLKAIEEGDLKKLPRGYDRIFMKSYLLALEVDVDLFLQEFDHLLGRREPTQVIDLDDLDRDRQKRDVAIKDNIKYALLWSPVVVILAILIYIFVSFGENGNGETEMSDQIPEIKVEDYIDDIDSVQSAIIVPEKTSDSLVADLVGLRRTWVRSVIDRRDTVEFVLTANSRRRLEADSLLTFIIGVGDGVVIETQDSVYRDLAPEGQVIKRLILDRNGIRYLLYGVPAATGD